MSNDKMWWKFIECDCMSEGVMVSTDSDDPTVYVAFFGNFFDRTFGLGQRLRFAWHVLTTGKPYTDMVCLTTAKARELALTLNEVAEKNELRQIIAEDQAEPTAIPPTCCGCGCEDEDLAERAIEAEAETDAKRDIKEKELMDSVETFFKTLVEHEQAHKIKQEEKSERPKAKRRVANKSKRSRKSTKKN
jgi:hypothetical protein